MSSEIQLFFEKGTSRVLFVNMKINQNRDRDQMDKSQKGKNVEMSEKTK